MEENESGHNVVKFILSLLLTLGAGFIAGLFSTNAGSIYGELKQPAFAPPSWLFMPVWIILYTLMGIAFFRILIKGHDTRGFGSAVEYFILQLVFNVLWSVFFFSLNLRGAALVDIVILFIYILITTVKFFKIDKPAGLLMLPYLIWVAFAAVLNFFIVVLNG